MKIKPSPMPESFANDNEKEYWHMAQDTAYRAGYTLLLGNGITWLTQGDIKELIVEPLNPETTWYDTWLILHEKYKGLSRLWVGGRPLEP